MSFIMIKDKVKLAAACFEEASKVYPTCFDQPSYYANECGNELHLVGTLLFRSTSDDYNADEIFLIHQNPNIVCEKLDFHVPRLSFRPREMSQINIYRSEQGRHTISFSVFHKGSSFHMFTELGSDLLGALIETETVFPHYF